MTSTTLCLGFNQAAHPVVSEWELDSYGLCKSCAHDAQEAATRRRNALELQALRPAVVWVIETTEHTAYGSVTVEYGVPTADRQAALDECWRLWTRKSSWRYAEQTVRRVIPFVRAEYDPVVKTMLVMGPNGVGLHIPTDQV